jgi:hypothetical protein
MSRICHLFIPFIAVASAACQDSMSCTGLGLEVLPVDTMIAVGQSFTPRVSSWQCAGTPPPTALIWRSEDTTVLAVDPATGRATGRAPGEAAALLASPGNGDPQARVRVTVVPVP